MDGGSADHAGAVICRITGDPPWREVDAVVARGAGSYSGSVRASHNLGILRCRRPYHGRPPLAQEVEPTYMRYRTTTPA